MTELQTYHLVAIPGDGIGPEVLDAGRRVLEATGERFGFRFEWTEVLLGGVAIDAYGVPMRDEDVEVCRAADAVYLGAVGGPKWDDPNAKVRPEQGLLGIRKALDLYANLRPVVVEPVLAAASTLRPETVAGVDFVIVRELTSGLYFGKPSEERVTPEGRVAVDTLWYTEHEIARVIRLAFELARGRRKKLTSVDKMNVLSTSRLWHKVAEEIAPEFPDVTLEHQLVDSCAMKLVRQPASFDVMVMDNMFGDILSDEGSMIAGSLGMLPSASIGSGRTKHGWQGLYEPIHGSAPGRAGKDTANPIATILSGAMLLRWSLSLPKAADAVEDAVRATLADGVRTGDLMLAGDEGKRTVVGTKGMADAIIERIAIPGAVAR
jgi:3-isopropylmalate dehydrogenase